MIEELQSDFDAHVQSTSFVEHLFVEQWQQTQFTELEEKPARRQCPPCTGLRQKSNCQIPRRGQLLKITCVDETLIAKSSIDLTRRFGGGGIVRFSKSEKFLADHLEFYSARRLNGIPGGFKCKLNELLQFNE
ncbi:hypothetical protein MAR_027462 [Mya arenaria]|uniref:Uncharacterized protein n=1 Tax=Mya arenaria TaxID=6604 RepID=A0ABY7ETI5_MYAAR|nr:hypothetical protein MAR_027462 [Mya arenaria]